MDISVIVPFYRGNVYMEKLFACVAKNASKAPNLSIELVLVNDSPDCPIEYDPDWVRGFALQIENNPQNVGIHKTRINGLAISKGEYVVMLDQDDLLTDGALASQYAIGVNCDCVLANGYDQNHGGSKPMYRSLRHQKAATNPYYYYNVCNQIASPGQCLIRKTAIPKLWTQDYITKNGSDDLLLWLLMFEDGCKWEINPECLYTHVDTGRNLSSNMEKMLASSYAVLDFLRRHNAISDKKAKKFIRRTRLFASYTGKPMLCKLFALLRYPDFAFARLKLCVLKNR